MAERCVWCSDIERHTAKLGELKAAGLVDEHTLVKAARRRLRMARIFDDRAHGRTVDQATGAGGAGPL